MISICENSDHSLNDYFVTQIPTASLTTVRIGWENVTINVHGWF